MVIDPLFVAVRERVWALIRAEPAILPLLLKLTLVWSKGPGAPLKRRGGASTATEAAMPLSPAVSVPLFVKVSISTAALTCRPPKIVPEFVMLEGLTFLIDEGE
jgi:hypothetical protein